LNYLADSESCFKFLSIMCFSTFSSLCITGSICVKSIWVFSKK